MGDELVSNGNVSESSGNNDGQSNPSVIDIFTLSNYYFGSKEAIPFKEETLADRVQRLKSK
jgi:cleavage and polyadenylation specificity factor subunit 5